MASPDAAQRTTEAATVATVEQPDPIPPATRQEANALYMGLGGVGFLVWVLVLWSLTIPAKEWAKTIFGSAFDILADGDKHTAAKVVMRFQRSTIMTIPILFGSLGGTFIGPVIGGQFGQGHLSDGWYYMVGVIAGALAIGLQEFLDIIDLPKLLSKMGWAFGKGAVAKVAGDAAAEDVAKTTSAHPPITQADVDRHLADKLKADDDS